METGASSQKVTVGRLLQDARSAKGLTIEEAAAASKVPLSFVRLMEGEQFHLIPDPFYVIRFLFEYSVFLGLSPKQVEAQFRHQMSLARSSAPLEAPPVMSFRVPLRRLLLYLLPAAAAVPLIFIVLSLFSGKAPEQPTARQQQLQPSQEAPRELPEVRVAPSPIPHPASPGVDQPTGVKPTQSPASVAARVPAGQPFRHTLRAEAKGTTWLAVSSDGSARQEILLRPGQTMQWSANKGFVISIGNAEGLALSLDGKSVILTQGQSGVIRRLTLPGEGKPVPVR